MLHDAYKSINAWYCWDWRLLRWASAMQVLPKNVMPFLWNRVGKDCLRIYTWPVAFFELRALQIAGLRISQLVVKDVTAFLCTLDTRLVFNRFAVIWLFFEKGSAQCVCSWILRVVQMNVGWTIPESVPKTDWIQVLLANLFLWVDSLTIGNPNQFFRLRPRIFFNILFEAFYSTQSIYCSKQLRCAFVECATFLFKRDNLAIRLSILPCR